MLKPLPVFSALRILCKFRQAGESSEPDLPDAAEHARIDSIASMIYLKPCVGYNQHGMRRRAAGNRKPGAHFKPFKNVRRNK
jgi:hypothetical protein